MQVDREIAALIVALEGCDLPPLLDESNTINILIDPVYLFITKRPHYCDRGRWLVNAESRDPSIVTIDFADGFPRYYYYSEALVMEVTKFFEVKLLQVQMARLKRQRLQQKNDD